MLYIYIYICIIYLSAFTYTLKQIPKNLCDFFDFELYPWPVNVALPLQDA